MHTVQNYELSIKTKQIYQCGKQARTSTPVIILKWKYRLEKVRRIYENYAQNLQVTRAEFVFFGATF